MKIVKNSIIIFKKNIFIRQLENFKFSNYLINRVSSVLCSKGYHEKGFNVFDRTLTLSPSNTMKILSLWNYNKAKAYFYKINKSGIKNWIM